MQLCRQWCTGLHRSPGPKSAARDDTGELRQKPKWPSRVPNCSILPSLTVFGPIQSCDADWRLPYANLLPLGSLSTHSGVWSADWAWGLPLIVVTVVLHVLCLGLMNQTVSKVLHRFVRHPHDTGVFVMVVAGATLLATWLHGFEAILWAAAYRHLNALPDNDSAVLYSLSAITSYGHANLVLESRWQLMGALEALNGWLLFGLTTAFLFALINKVWSMNDNLLATRPHPKTPITFPRAEAVSLLPRPTRPTSNR